MILSATIQYRDLILFCEYLSGSCTSILRIIFPSICLSGYKRHNCLYIETSISLVLFTIEAWYFVWSVRLKKVKVYLLKKSSNFIINKTASAHWPNWCNPISTKVQQLFQKKITNQTNSKKFTKSYFTKNEIL